MISKAFRSKKKVFCGVLATVLAFNFCGIFKPVSAMFGVSSERDDSDVSYCITLDMFRKLASDSREYDYYSGYAAYRNPSIIEAINNGDVESVASLLANDSTKNSEGFEYTCGIDLARINCEEWELYYKIFDIFNNRGIKINAQKLNSSIQGEQTVWNLYGRTRYKG